MTVAISHVRIKGTTYWFRRRVPTSLTLLVGRKEILRSLRTSNAREARRRANLLWVQADRIFEKMADNKDSSELEALYQQIENMGKEFQEIAESQEQAIGMLETANRIQTLQSELDLANKNVEIASLKENSALKDMVIVDKVGKLKPSPKLTKKIDDYASQLRQVGDNGKVTTEQTISQVRMTIRLFQEFFGDKPVREYGRDVSSEFKKLLGQLPSSHGKSRSNPMTAPQAIKANQALAVPLTRLANRSLVPLVKSSRRATASPHAEFQTASVNRQRLWIGRRFRPQTRAVAKGPLMPIGVQPDLHPGFLTLASHLLGGLGIGLVDFAADVLGVLLRPLRARFGALGQPPGVTGNIGRILQHLGIALDRGAIPRVFRGRRRWRGRGRVRPACAGIGVGPPRPGWGREAARLPRLVPAMA